MVRVGEQRVFFFFFIVVDEKKMAASANAPPEHFLWHCKHCNGFKLTNTTSFSQVDGRCRWKSAHWYCIRCKNIVIWPKPPNLQQVDHDASYPPPGTCPQGGVCRLHPHWLIDFFPPSQYSRSTSDSSESSSFRLEPLEQVREANATSTESGAESSPKRAKTT